MTVEYRNATLEDVVALSLTMRQGDIDEVAASNGISPYEALLLGYEVSDATSVFEDGKVVAMYGCAGAGDGIGSPWLLGSDRLAHLKKELLTRPIKWLEEKNKEYPLLVNYVDARNKVAIRWLRFLGFTFIRKIEKYGVGRKPFYEFVRISSHV